MRRKDISSLDADVVIVFCGGLRGKEFSLTSLKVMLKVWEETRKKKELLHVMVALKWRFKGNTGEKCHMLPLLDITKSLI